MSVCVVISYILYYNWNIYTFIKKLLNTECLQFRFIFAFQPSYISTKCIINFYQCILQNISPYFYFWFFYLICIILVEKYFNVFIVYSIYILCISYVFTKLKLIWIISSLFLIGSLLGSGHKHCLSIFSVACITLSCPIWGM